VLWKQIVFYLHCFSALFEIVPLIKQKKGEMEIEWNTSISGVGW
jgi:hypothetical protein